MVRLNLNFLAVKVSQSPHTNLKTKMTVMKNMTQAHTTSLRSKCRVVLSLLPVQQEMPRAAVWTRKEQFLNDLHYSCITFYSTETLSKKKVPGKVIKQFTFFTAGPHFYKVKKVVRIKVMVLTAIQWILKQFLILDRRTWSGLFEVLLCSRLWSRSLTEFCWRNPRTSEKEGALMWKGSGDKRISWHKMQGCAN